MTGWQAVFVAFAMTATYWIGYSVAWQKALTDQRDRDRIRQQAARRVARQNR